MTKKQRKTMIEQWVTQINPKAILRAADARCGGKVCRICGREARRVRDKMHRLSASGAVGAIPSWGILCQRV